MGLMPSEPIGDCVPRSRRACRNVLRPVAGARVPVRTSITVAMDLHLADRPGWPEDLRVLLDRYPREVWPEHGNLGQTARVWLRRHQMFRDLGASLQRGVHKWREGETTAADFKPWFAPRLQFFLSELEGHHHIEDASYFPIFREAEPRLLRGFDVLENDHAVIHERIERVVDAANALLRSSGADRQRRATGDYAQASDRLLGGLLRHLDDEEDLIVR
jgi:hemerythrin-like domain-containing protein